MSMNPLTDNIIRCTFDAVKYFSLIHVNQLHIFLKIRKQNILGECESLLKDITIIVVSTSCVKVVTTKCDLLIL